MKINPYKLDTNCLVVPYGSIDTGFHIWPWYNREKAIVQKFRCMTAGSLFIVGDRTFQIISVDANNRTIDCSNTTAIDIYMTTLLFECVDLSDQSKYTFKMQYGVGMWFHYTSFGFSKGIADFVMKSEQPKPQILNE